MTDDPRQVLPLDAILAIAIAAQGSAQAALAAADALCALLETAREATAHAGHTVQ